MRFLAFVVLAAQIICAIHAAKRNRYPWLYGILLLPAAGCIAYFFIHILPKLRHNYAVEEAGDQLIKTIAPSRMVIKLQKQLEFSDTIENRQRLAKEYKRIGAYEEAIKLNEECLEGIYENEPDILYEQAYCLNMVESYEKAEKHLLQLFQHHDKERHKEAALLLAITYEKQEKNKKSEKEYKELIDVYPGEEARCRYALLLKRLNRTEEATKMFRRILLNTDESPRYYRRNQRQWTNLAKQNLKEMQIQAS